MQLLKYMEAADLAAKTEVERAKLLCFYHFKEDGETTFIMSNISAWMEECSFSKPNTSRLKTNLTKGKGRAFLGSKANKNAIEFVPTVLQTLERDYGALWTDTVTIESHDELIEEAKFCGKRPFLTRLIQQINFTYGHNCYDACAVLMRRLFEVLLVLAYQNKGIETDITKNFDAFREVGNNSAHSITYTAGKLDIDNISRDYRVMMEDLYNRAGLM